MFSLESPQRGDSNEYTHYSIFQYKKENIPKLSQICNYGICSKGLKNEFETAVVNEPSEFEPSKFYCICICRGANVVVFKFSQSCQWDLFLRERICSYRSIQSTLVISTSVISNNRLSRRENLVLVLMQKSKIKLQNIVEKRRNCSWGAISPLFHNIFNIYF